MSTDHKKIRQFFNLKTAIVFAIYLLWRLGYDNIPRIEFMIYGLITAVFITFF